jgi:hypothetical protein
MDNNKQIQSNTRRMEEAQRSGLRINNMWAISKTEAPGRARILRQLAAKAACASWHKRKTVKMIV